MEILISSRHFNDLTLDELPNTHDKAECPPVHSGVSGLQYVRIIDTTTVTNVPINLMG